MTQTEKRIKISETIGLVWRKAEDGFWDLNGDNRGVDEEEMLRQLGSYFSDLNHTRKAERWLADNTAFSSVYWRKIVETVCADSDEPLNFDECTMFMAVTAHAEQRAEAFGLTLNLWQPGE